MISAESRIERGQTEAAQAVVQATLRIGWCRVRHHPEAGTTGAPQGAGAVEGGEVGNSETLPGANEHTAMIVELSGRDTMSAGDAKQLEPQASRKRCHSELSRDGAEAELGAGGGHDGSKGADEGATVMEDRAAAGGGSADGQRVDDTGNGDDGDGTGGRGAAGAAAGETKKKKKRRRAKGRKPLISGAARRAATQAKKNAATPGIELE